MNISEILLILVAIFNFTVAGFIFGRNRKSHINISFALMYLFAAFWSLGLALFRIAINPNYALSYNSEIFIAALLIAPSFLYFSYVFPFPLFIIKVRKVLYIYIPAVLMSILLLVPEVKMNRILTAKNNLVDLHWAYYLYSFIFVIYIILAMVVLIRKYIKSDGVIKHQLKLILTGMIFGLIVGMSFNLFLPLIGNYNLAWVGPYSAFVVMIFVYYLISKKE